MRIIKLDNKDISVTTFYGEEGTYVVGLIIIHPDYQNRDIATNIKHKLLDYDLFKNFHKSLFYK